MCTTLKIDINNKYYISPAKFPIFDGIDNLRLRSLIAVGVGCDVYLKSTMTVKQMSECITQIKTTYENNNASQAYQLLKAKLISARFNRMAPPNTNVDESKILFSDMIEAFVDAYMYEPCNILKSRTNPKQFTFG